MILSGMEANKPVFFPRALTRPFVRSAAAALTILALVLRSSATAPTRVILPAPQFLPAAGAAAACLALPAPLLALPTSPLAQTLPALPAPLATESGAAKPLGEESPAPYGLPSALPAAVRPHEPSADETARMRAEYLRITRDEEEIFDAPGWIQKIMTPALKAAFQVAAAEDVMIDIANGIHAEVPTSIQGDPVTGLAAMRLEAWKRWRDAEKLNREAPMTPARAFALKQLDALHRAGLVPPGFERPGDDMSAARAAYARLLALVSGGGTTTRTQAQADVVALAREWRNAIAPLRRNMAARKGTLAREADAAIVGVPRAAPADAKVIYETSLSRAKDATDPDNVRHFLARLAAMSARATVKSPNLGRQVRPSCTLHMLRAMLSALGVNKDMPTLVAEARTFLNDPFIASTTAFDESMQRRLFAHYGTVHEVPRAEIFRTLIAKHRSLKVRIEIGDPVYQHTLILEGLYELDGKTYVSLRDSTSYFPTRMELSDFAKVLTDDPALYFSDVHSPDAPLLQ